MTKTDMLQILDLCIEIEKETGVKIVFNYSGPSNSVDIYCYRDNVIDVENHIDLFRRYLEPSPMAYKLDVKQAEAEIRNLIP